ncbi:DNA cytosine methyltransferase [Candidatus Saccharibacteria bacterium]|nr:DNA cytosine methyltransferase [Candidatus Saccharibacteria bacterium]
MLHSETESIPYVSLFSGAMGLDLGLNAAGFHPVVANDIDRAAVATIRYNCPDLPIITKGIQELQGKDFTLAAGGDFSSLPLVAGGPPCQPFSVFGRRRGTTDPRGSVLLDFVRVVLELQPVAFLLENVRGLHSMPLVRARPEDSLDGIPAEDLAHGSLLRELIQRFEDGGYRVDCFLVNVVNYGGPQIRERLICIGNRYNAKVTFPEPTHSNRPEDEKLPFRVLGDVIGDGFEDPDPTLMNFSERKLNYLAQIPPGGNWRSLPPTIQKESMGKTWYLKGGRSAYWRKLSFEFPSPTVVTMPNHAGTSMCHPTELRALTVGECAAIQEFPASWAVQGTPAERYRLLGNAVPVRLGKIAGEVVCSLLQEIRERSFRPTSTQKIQSSIQHIRPHVRTRKFWRKGEAFAGDYSYHESIGGASVSR